MGRRTKFISLNSHYYFQHSILINKSLLNSVNNLNITGKLVHNNGQIVPISVNHNTFIKKYLNEIS